MSAAGFPRRALSALSLALLAAGPAVTVPAAAADTIVWSETTGFSNTASIAVATPPGSTAQLVTDQTKVKGPNGVEFIDGRIWWPNQQRVPVSNGFTTINRYVIGSSLPDGTDVKTINTGGIAYDLDIQGNTLFWTDQNGGIVWKIDLTTTSKVSDILLSELTSPFAIDATSDKLYWSQVGSSRRIMRSDLDGSNATTLLTGITSYDFEVVGSQIYYTTIDGFVKRSDLDGSNLVTLASGQGFLNGIDVTNDAIYVSVLEGVFDGPGFSTLGAGRIRKMNLDGSDNLELIVGQQNFTSGVPFDPAKVRGVAVLTAPVPEPQTYTLMLAGVALVAAAVRRRP